MLDENVEKNLNNADKKVTKLKSLKLNTLLIDIVSYI